LEEKRVPSSEFVLVSEEVLGFAFLGL
jgi:hypothetical protein